MVMVEALMGIGVFDVMPVSEGGREVCSWLDYPAAFWLHIRARATVWPSLGVEWPLFFLVIGVVDFATSFGATLVVQPLNFCHIALCVGTLAGVGLQCLTTCIEIKLLYAGHMIARLGRNCITSDLSPQPARRRPANPEGCIVG